MELTPDLLLEAKFAPARRGYDMAEVDDFLERCAEGLDVLLARLKAEFERAERAEAEVARLRAAGGDAAAPAPAAEAPAPAQAPAAEPSVDEPMRILIHAERTAEAAIADARAEAQRIRTEAEAVASTQRSEAEAMLATARAEAEAEAKRAGDEMRRSIQAEVMALRGDRDALNDDVRNLRRWLDDQRTRLRTAARDLQRLVDDPAALRELAVPELTGSQGPVEEAVPEAEAVVDDDSDGEPTQAVPAVGGMSFFDDQDDQDDVMSAGSGEEGGEQPV